MGAKADCSCIYRDRRGEGTAHLETDHLIFRGDLNLAIPLSSVISATASSGRLNIVFHGGEATFDLGNKAAKWAEKILSPPTLMKKLGVKPESSVGLSGVQHDDFSKELKRVVGDISEKRMRKDRDLIFFGVQKKTDLTRLVALKRYLKPEGAIWVIRPKGVKEITESDVMRDGKKAGLIDVKVARFSETHTAEKFVIPKSKRHRTGSGTRKKKARV
ncbi:MAG: DUF3052 domain-containing protein [Actinomycetota bacterium]|nr:DUF3052 domain-containing protein [Actinomycetota bacterium]